MEKFHFQLRSHYLSRVTYYLLLRILNKLNKTEVV